MIFPSHPLMPINFLSTKVDPFLYKAPSQMKCLSYRCHITKVHDRNKILRQENEDVSSEFIPTKEFGGSGKCHAN